MLRKFAASSFFNLSVSNFFSGFSSIKNPQSNGNASYCAVYTNKSLERLHYSPETVKKFSFGKWIHGHLQLE